MPAGCALGLFSARLWRPASPFDKLRARTTVGLGSLKILILSSQKILILSLSKDEDFHPG
ncbi:MAG: hypothetical protein B7Z12_04710 [Caulobacter vibrioides]|uniref:Uncharacterized protein n=1 Tax=Caulobacter vibrioides TaxID=155892 RepID=A0A258DBG7_CAUVI|nr:MAG: hypothetical protein B7Z12_04710 [Caulobacter vibrioides]